MARLGPKWPQFKHAQHLSLHPFIVLYIKAHLDLALVAFVDGIAILLLVVVLIFALVPDQYHGCAAILT